MRDKRTKQDQQLRQPTGDGCSRRRFLGGSLAAGALLAFSVPAESASIAETMGEVLVNGARAMRDTVIRVGDRIETAAGASLVFRIGNDAFLVREMSTVMLEAPAGAKALLAGLRLVTGAVLAVFGPGMRSVMTGLVTGAIRGTGIYVEATPSRTYFCTCYGNVGLTAKDGTTKDVKTANHAAHYIEAKSGAAGSIVAAPMLNHNNQELAMLEKLAGRAPRLRTDRN
jgi:hypothetical protein